MGFDDFQDKFSKAVADSKKADDFARHQDAIAGRETGRILPHVGGNSEAAKAKGKRKQNETAEFLTNLQILMQDPEYAALHNDVSDLLRRAEKVAESALIRTEEALAELLENAVRLPDGRAVFIDRNGNVRTEDGKIIDPVIAESLVFPENAPSYESYRAHRERVEGIRRYQVETLGHARERLEDQDNPPSKNELKDLQRDIETGLDTTIQRQTGADETPENTYNPSSNVDVPKLDG